MMSGKDYEIRTTIENILENNSSGQCLRKYFDELPDKNIRRAISILSSIYPDETTISNDDFSFIIHMFSDIKFIKQKSFFQFVCSINILKFTDHQKKLLIDTIKNNIEILCDQDTYDLGYLLVNLFEPNELFQYLEVITEKGSRPVLQQIYDILWYEDFSNSYGLDEKIEALKQKVSKLINCKLVEPEKS